MFTQVLGRIGMLFLIMAIGAIARFAKVLNDRSIEKLTSLTVNITLPLLYFSTLSTQITFGLFKTIWYLPLFGVALVFLSFGVAKIFSPLLGLENQKKYTYLFLATFTNYGFLAIPIAFALYSQKGLSVIAVFNVGLSFCFWSFGIWLLNRATKKDIKISFKNLINNGIIAIVLGLFFGLLAIKIPDFILTPARLVGWASIPIALIVIGATLAQKSVVTNIPFKTISILVLCRLILVPAIALALLCFFKNLSPIAKAIILLQAVMPSASSTTIFTKKFGGNTELASQGVFFTTLISIITIPLFLTFLGT